MRNVLSANLFRLRKSALFWGLLLVSAAFGALFTLQHVMAQKQAGHNFPLSIDFFAYPLLLGFGMAVFIPLFFGAEYSDGTIRNKIALGCPRLSVYLVHLLTGFGAAILAGIAYLIPVLTIGIPAFDPLPMDSKTLSLLLLGSLALLAAYCALYTAATMNCGRKSTAAVVCLAGMMAVYFLTGGIENRLAYPESTPYYVSGAARAVLETTFDLSPVGQSLQYLWLEAVDPVRLALYSLGIAVAVTTAGLALFQRKDLK